MTNWDKQERKKMTSEDNAIADFKADFQTSKRSVLLATIPIFLVQVPITFNKVKIVANQGPGSMDIHYLQVGLKLPMCLCLKESSCITFCSNKTYVHPLRKNRH
jgi:hypothetical protein